MGAASLRERAALCLRISRGLSWNNPGRFQLTDLAERLERQAKEIDLQNREKEADTSQVGAAKRSVVEPSTITVSPGW
jgi:hypothetical protein